MAKFSGKVGFASFVETSPGVSEESITEKSYYGDLVKNTNRWVDGDRLNDDISIRNVVSIVADPYAFENFFSMRYVTWMGQRWTITNVDIQRPRIELSLGELYNG